MYLIVDKNEYILEKNLPLTYNHNIHYMECVDFIYKFEKPP